MQNNYTYDTVSSTDISCNDTYLILSRFINSKLCKITFSHDVNACKLIPYFNMNDEQFKRFERKV